MSQDIEPRKPCILVVDDEVNILRSMRRTLHKLDVDLLLAETPEKALELLDSRKIDVVVSDMKMPSMNGAQLLAKVAEQQPNSFRIILSGYADIESMLAAINQGKVHRYLNKPWNNDDFLNVINEGIEISQLRSENARLLELTQQQNKKLSENNQQLEKKVQLRTRQINSALTRIKQHNAGLERVLYNVIVSHPNIDGKFARQVSESALQLAKALGLPEKEQMVVRLAGLVCEIGLVGLSHELIEKSFLSLTHVQQKAFMSQANIAQVILAPLHGLEEETQIIACQFEPVNKYPEPPTGAKIISICRDYWRYIMGRIQDHNLLPIHAHREMLKYAGVRYDKAILNTFLSLDNYTLDQISVGLIDSDTLKPGMILKKDLFNDLHILILPEGHVFTDNTINRLKKFELGHGTKMKLDVERAEITGVIE